ncbi:MAG TPA: Ldh family oxidoreductase [Pseudonocardiaceae bacterium]|nr:Ldh family oxidoreductase [Pseudonocardiaceae bacterium]
MTGAASGARSSGSRQLRVAYQELVSFIAAVFTGRGVPAERARTAAQALCYGDLAGMSSHGVANLTRLYLPLFDQRRVEPAAEPATVADLGACALLDARRGLGLWVASEAMDSALRRARVHGVGVVSVRSATHFGCAGYHAARAVPHDAIGLIAANCGRQRIARPPGGKQAMLGTNPLSVAAPAAGQHPFVLDMSTTVVPTGRVRAAARAGTPVPVGWLADDQGDPVTDPAALDRGEAHLLWLGEPGTGGYKGYGLGLLVEVLAGLVSGSGLGPAPEALAGDGAPAGRDDDIGFVAMAIAPGALRPRTDFRRDAESLFGTLLATTPLRAGDAVRYPGWHEAECSRQHLRTGVPLAPELHAELVQVAEAAGVPAPRPMSSSASRGSASSDGTESGSTKSDGTESAAP